MFQLSLKILLTVLIVLIILGLGAFVSGKFSQNQMFSSPFECGLEPYKTSKVIFSSRFFIMALIFLIFDTELILLFPFLVAVMNLMIFSLVLALFFINMLSFGLYYEWNFSVMEWLY